jgi:ribosomal-protein-serine acetyltransferase
MAVAVTIRPLAEDDTGEITLAVRESFAELSPWMPWCHEQYSVSDAASWVQTAKAARESGAMYDFAIVDPGGRYAGACGINRINRFDGVGNIGYWVRTSCVGRGFVSAAVRHLIPWAFANIPLNRLEIVVAVGNERSHRVAERVGAHRDAVLRKRLMLKGVPQDAVLYSVIRPDSAATLSVDIPS